MASEIHIDMVVVYIAEDFLVPHGNRAHRIFGSYRKKLNEGYRHDSHLSYFKIKTYQVMRNIRREVEKEHRFK